MPCVKIKQLDERVSTDGLHLGGSNSRRKLQPGEVVDIPEDFEAGMYDGQSLLDILWATGKLEMTLDKASRPIEFKDYREAQLTSSTFKSRGPDDDRNVEKAREAVAARMAETSEVPPENGGSPADDIQPEPATETVTEAPPPPARNRRAERRAALQAAQRGEAITT